MFLLPIIAGIGYAGYLLFKDYHPNQTNIEDATTRETVGYIVSADNNVKRQFGDDVLWGGVDPNNPVYNKDSIRTGKDSQATIKLNDGTVVELGENSLIVLDKSPETLNINFKAGDIAATNSGSDLQINVKDSQIKADGADLKIKTGADAKAQIEVAKGKASITDKNKKKTEIGQSESADLDENGVKQITKISVILKTPLDKTQVRSNLSEISQPFTWEVTDPSLKQEQFEISKDNKFSPEGTKALKGHQALTANLAPGTYFWRVAWASGSPSGSPAPSPLPVKMNYSEVRTLTVGLDKRLELIDPENGTQFDLSPDENNVELVWNSLIEPKVYVTEVSTSRDFKNIVANHTVKTTKDTVKDLPAANYFWRVRAFGEQNQELAVSPIFGFSLRLKVPKLPELIKPLNNSTWNLPPPVEFSWKKVDAATDYRITISTDPDQKQVVKTKTAPDLTFSWKPTNEDTYYWSVKALGVKGKLLGQSEIRKFLFKVKDLGAAFQLVSPKDLSEIVRDLSGDSPEPVTFQWKVLRALPGPISIEISHTNDFKEPVKQDNLTKDSLPVRLKTPGTYFWRMLSSSPDGTYQDVSPIWTFSVKALVNLLSPQIIEPNDKDSIEISAPTPVKFSWKPVTGAAQYHIAVQRLDPRTQKQVTVMDQMVKETTVTSTALPEGNYTWSLVSVDAQAQEGLTGSLYHFSMIPPTQVDAPTLNAPVIK